jgi:hypothetical protein
MKAFAEDRGALPAQFGANLLAPGLIYGITVFVAWGMLIGALHLPMRWIDWLWVPGTLVYLPVLRLIERSNRSETWGPSKQVFSAAWTAMGIMSAAVLVCLVLARGRYNAPFLLLWPPMAFTLYGGTWTMVGIIRRQPWYWVVGVGCFVTAFACASLISKPTEWLVMGIGILLWVAVPGAVIMFRARATE